MGDRGRERTPLFTETEPFPQFLIRPAAQILLQIIGSGLGLGLGLGLGSGNGSDEGLGSSDGLGIGVGTGSGSGSWGDWQHIQQGYHALVSSSHKKPPPDHNL